MGFAACFGLRKKKNSRAHFDPLLLGTGLVGDYDEPLVLAGGWGRDGRHLRLDGILYGIPGESNGVGSNSGGYRLEEAANYVETRSHGRIFEVAYGLAGDYIYHVWTSIRLCNVRAF